MGEVNTYSESHLLEMGLDTPSESCQLFPILFLKPKSKIIISPYVLRHFYIKVWLNEN